MSLPVTTSNEVSPAPEPDVQSAGKSKNGAAVMNEQDLLKRITIDARIFGGKPIIRGHRLAVEHVLGMLAAGDTPEVLLDEYPWLEPEDIQACLVYARRLVGHERVEPLLLAEVLLDSCIGRRIREALEAAGHDVAIAAIDEIDPGDEAILRRAHREGRILITLDKDHGEELTAGSILTVEPGRLRIRPAG
jgi:uncharacterized protein (DUF433 family)